MKSKQALLTVALLLIAISLIVFVCIAIKTILQGQFNWLLLLTILAELSLLSSLKKIIQKNK